MKKCPKCSREYFDITLEFCLEDGAHLIFNDATTNISFTQPSPQTSAKTVAFVKTPTNKLSGQVFDKAPVIDNFLNQSLIDKSTSLKEKVTHQSYKLIETLPIVISLAHNYWQWLYLSKSNTSDLISFLTSVSFIVWIILLIGGTASGFIALKYGKNKDFAITSLVILAINFLLSIVPR